MIMDTIPMHKVNLEILIGMASDNVKSNDAKDVEFAIKKKLKTRAIAYIKRLKQELVTLPNDSTVKIDGGLYSHAMICGAIAILKMEHDIEDNELQEIDIV